MHVAASDVEGMGLFGGFGLWWLLFPQSVVRFYTWFHRGKVRLPGLLAVRIMGAVVIIAVLLTEWSALRRGPVGP